jgi:hypothetical protein
MSDTPTPDSAALERARAIKQAHEAALMALPNVVGVGVGLRSIGGELTGEVAIVVSVTEKLLDDDLEPAERIPAEIDGVPVDVQATGPFIAG